MDFQILCAISFAIILVIFLYIKRKNIDRENILFPVFYMLLYRTKIGLKFMKSTSKKHPKFWTIFSIIGIITGFIGMVLISVLLMKSLVDLFVNPAAQPGVAPVLPIKAKGVFYVPFFYWITCIILIAIVHEYAHGIIARLHKVKIKSSGFAFFSIFIPLIPAAFVEPDEKQVERKKVWQQLGIFAAGPFANILFGIFSLVVYVFVLTPMLSAGVMYDGIMITNVINETPAFEYGLEINDIVYSIDGEETLDLIQFSEVLSTKNPGDTIFIETQDDNIELVLTNNPDNSESAFIGVNPSQNLKDNPEFTAKYGSFSLKALKALYQFFFWLYLLNIGIGLFNLTPLGPVDGGRMVRAVLLKFLKKERALKIWGWISTFFLVLILFMLFFPYIRPLLPF